jgi:PAT family beta-lactamase induction signal transducer AmpG
VITALAILPWTFKFAWAPMIDTFRMPSLGLRRPWIVLAQAGMALTLLGAWSTGALEESATISFLAWVFFAHNCFASLQDVATDALAVDLLEDKERGRVNGLMWGSKLFGISAGGGGMGVIIASSSVQTAVLVQALGIIAILLVVLAVRERAGERLFPWSQGSTQVPESHHVKGGVLGVARELFRALSTRTTFLAMLMAGTVNLGEGLYVPLTTELFVQKFQWTAAQFSSFSGLWGVLGELTGALLGGILCDRLGRRNMAGLGMIMTSATLLLFAATSAHWTTPGYPQGLIIPFFKGAMAFTTVSLFSLYMKISWTRAAATQFTLYMAMSNVGYALGAGLNRLDAWIDRWEETFPFLQGVTLVEPHYFVVAGALTLFPIVFLGFLDPDDIVQRKITVVPVSSSAPEG